MATAKFTPTKKIVAVCVRNQKPYQLPTLQRQAKVVRLLKASRAEEVRTKLERLEETTPKRRVDELVSSFQELDSLEPKVMSHGG